MVQHFVIFILKTAHMWIPRLNKRTQKSIIVPYIRLLLSWMSPFLSTDQLPDLWIRHLDNEGIWTFMWWKRLVKSLKMNSTLGFLLQCFIAYSSNVFFESNSLNDADHMMAMKMIDQAHDQGGKVRSFTSYCGGLPSPAAANNPLAYKFR